MGRILLAEQVENLGLKVARVVENLLSDDLPPGFEQCDRLLADLLESLRVQIVFADDETEVHEVGKTLADTRLV